MTRRSADWRNNAQLLRDWETRSPQLNVFAARVANARNLLSHSETPTPQFVLRHGHRVTVLDPHRPHPRSLQR
jgi:hypothetical protein